MTRIEDITDPDGLEAWLVDRALSQEQCIAVASRIAMRAAPLEWLNLRPASLFGGRKGEISGLVSLRGALVAHVASFGLTPALQTAARRADTALRDVEPRGGVQPDLSRPALVAALACERAPRAVRAAFHGLTVMSPDDPLTPILADLSTLEKGDDLTGCPLWLSSRPGDLEDHWTRLRAIWDKAAWRFWIDWYEAALDGRPRDLDMLTEIATRPDAFWQGTDDAVTARIARVCERHELLGQVRALKAERDAWRQSHASRAQRSHNLPPELVDAPEPVQREVLVIWDRLDDAERELEKTEPDIGRLAAIARVILSGCRAVLAYFARLGDNVVSGASKAAGPPIGLWVVDHFVLNGRLSDFAQRLLTFAAGG